MKQRVLSILLTLVMALSFLPMTALAEVTDTNDWVIFDVNGDNIPETQEQILTMMIQNENFFPWFEMANMLNADPDLFPKFADSTDVYYSNQGLKSVVSLLTSVGLTPSGVDQLSMLPDTPQDVYYVYETKEDDLSAAYSIMMFYDFAIEGVNGAFNTPEFAVGDTISDLQDSGVRIDIGANSDSYSVTAENPNSFENKVEKSYAYSKSVLTSTSVSNEYTKDWTEETTVGVEFKIPVLPTFGLSGKVEQSFAYSYGMSNTYTSTAEETYSQEITNAISAPLPAHTGIKIDVNMQDQTATIPYYGAVRVTFKTMIFFGAAGSILIDDYMYLDQDSLATYTVDCR